MAESKTKSTEQRRQALKKILAGTGAAGVVASAPEKWSKPMVDAITLPAHAVTSVPLSYTGNILIGLAPERGLEEILIPTAHAGVFDITNGSICVNFNADKTTYTVLVTDNSEGTRQFTGTEGTVGSELTLEETCSNMPSTLHLTLHSGPSLTGIPYTLCQLPSQNCINDTLSPSECSTTADICGD